MLTKTVVLAGLGALAHACTDTLLWSELPQGRTLSSRTMDFGIDLGASIWKVCVLVSSSFIRELFLHACSGNGEEQPRPVLERFCDELQKMHLA